MTDVIDQDTKIEAVPMTEQMQVAAELLKLVAVAQCNLSNAVALLMTAMANQPAFIIKSMGPLGPQHPPKANLAN